MSSARTQVSYLVPTDPTTTRRKLHREKPDKGGNVLPTTSNLNGSNANVYSIVGQAGSIHSSSRYPATSSSSLTREGSSLRTLSASQNGSSSLSRSHLPPRISATLASVKERRKSRHPEDVSKRNMVVDEDGVAHDSEYVAFRSATPVHLQRQRSTRSTQPVDDDGSASSSSASTASNESRFSSSPYTYTSTHRTTASTHYTPGLGTSSSSALPNRMLNKSGRIDRSDQPSLSAYSIAPASASSSSHLKNLDYDGRLPSSSKSRSTIQPSSYQIQPQRLSSSHRPTTSSYQPPAPFSSRLGDPGVSLRLPARLPSSNSSSLAGATARMSLADQDAGIDEQGGSGYNQYASSRPQQLDGSVLDAGVHGMKRSWDGFKLEMKFGVRRAKKNVERKILNL